VTLDSLRGRVGDVDSHEHVPTPRYAEVFGDRAQRFLDGNEGLSQILGAAGPDDPMNFLVDREEVADITPETVWETKGACAPSAITMDRRPEVLDAMGIGRALIFPGLGLVAMAMAHGGGYVGFPVSSPDQIELAEGAIDAYNEWAGQFTRKYPNRLRIVGVLASGRPGLTASGLIKKAEVLVGTGVKAVQMASGMPPAGLSPAHPDLDPFYRVLTDAGAALVFHPPSGVGFRANDVWGVAPGLPVDPTAVSVQLHAAEETFVDVLVMGGVLERHPDLRVGCIESGASWIGPLAERMDRMAAMMPGVFPISMKPSEYLSRQVRVSGLASFEEPFELYVDRYPALQDCYCYSSDYPHTEGLPHSLELFYQRLAPYGDDFLEKFFCTNSQLILQ